MLSHLALFRCVCTRKCGSAGSCRRLKVCNSTPHPPYLDPCTGALSVSLEDARTLESHLTVPLPLPLLPLCNACRLFLSAKLYNFVWDRFRMVRSDYNMQGFNPVVGLVSEASIVAHERMAR